MNFTLVYSLDAQYGSWGLLEDLHQDTTQVPAPKLSATLRYIANCEDTQQFLEWRSFGHACPELSYSPQGQRITITQSTGLPPRVHMYDRLGRSIKPQPTLIPLTEGVYQLERNYLVPGMYVLWVEVDGRVCWYKIFIQE
ncbi:MAG: hypothetical protein RMJ66_08370, partial [Bacteroidia bacterium]|nr:hypothetical protein [Bacteroidia bacterium]